jgi:hypothetical protein
MNLKKMIKSKKLHQPCRHFWVIEPPGAEFSLGICKYCGKHKRFMNSYQYRSFDKPIKKQVPHDGELVKAIK